MQWQNWKFHHIDNLLFNLSEIAITVKSSLEGIFDILTTIFEFLICCYEIELLNSFLIFFGFWYCFSFPFKISIKFYTSNKQFESKKKFIKFPWIHRFWRFLLHFNNTFYSKGSVILRNIKFFYECLLIFLQVCHF